MASNTPDQILVKKDPLRSIALGFMGICLVAAGIICLIMPMPYVDELSYRIWIGGFGTIGGAAVTVWSVRNLTVRNYKLKIDSTGIYDYSNWMSPGFISWDQVDSVYVLELGHNTYLSVDIKDRDAFVAGLSKRCARLAKANMESGFSPVRIQLASVTQDTDTAEAFKVVKKLHPKLTRGKVKIKAPSLTGANA